MKKRKPHTLDQEEKELLSSFENGEWKTVKNVDKEKARAQKAATLHKQREQSKTPR